MKKLMIAGAAALFAATVEMGGAQTKIIPGEMQVIVATVEAIDPGARQVTVKKQDGTHEVFTVPTTVKRFDALKVGDTIRARHYENIVLQVKAPGDTSIIDRAARDVATPAAQGTAGTLAHQRTITATITAIDPKVPSIAFTGPRGFQYSTKVKDASALSKVKVGDKVDITWTEALMVSIEDVK